MKRLPSGAERRTKSLAHSPAISDVTAKSTRHYGKGMHELCVEDTECTTQREEVYAAKLVALEAHARQSRIDAIELSGVQGNVFKVEQNGQTFTHQCSDAMLRVRLKLHRPVEQSGREHAGAGDNVQQSKLAIITLNDKLVESLNRAAEHGERLRAAIAKRNADADADADADTPSILDSTGADRTWSE